jgi:hypothetical protein
MLLTDGTVAGLCGPRGLCAQVVGTDLTGVVWVGPCPVEADVARLAQLLTLHLLLTSRAENCTRNTNIIYVLPFNFKATGKL